MSYHDLSSSTLDDGERVIEKDRIIKRLIENDADLTEKEQQFIDQIMPSKFVSVKQLFWLRDINNAH